MSRKIEELAQQVLALTASEFAELKWLIRRGGSGGLGVREPRRPFPATLPPADAEDRSGRGRTL